MRIKTHEDSVFLRGAQHATRERRRFPAQHRLHEGSAKRSDGQVAAPGFEQGLEGREKLHPMHGWRGETEALRERVVEMQRIVVAGDFCVARQRSRVEGSD